MSEKSLIRKRGSVRAIAVCGFFASTATIVTAFSTSTPMTTCCNFRILRLNSASTLTEDDEKLLQTTTERKVDKSEVESLMTSQNTPESIETPIFLKGLQEKIGTVDPDRLLFKEYVTGEVPRMFSSIEYIRQGDNKRVVTAKHAAGSVLGAASLIAGTTIGAGILALPSATVDAGFLPSTLALTSAYIYMTMSGLLIAELTLNRLAHTGKPGLGLLQLYESSLGKVGSSIATAAYFFLHYAIMVAYIAQGGKNVEQILGWDQYGSIIFTAVMGLSLFSAPFKLLEKVNNWMVVGVAATFLSIISMGVQTADFHALLDSSNQHPERVLSCFPIIFLALVYHNVVPTVVNNLEGDRSKIIKAIVGGTAVPFVMFLAWNAVCLGNALGTGADLTQVDSISLLQGGGDLMAPLVMAFSVLALATSVVGFTYGLVDAWTDKFQLPVKGEEYEAWKPALFGLVFVPPLVLSLIDPDIFYRALEYGGAFGVSTLFLILPPLMVWKERYSDTGKPLMTEPLVPLGKIPLASMWKAAGTLIVEQAAEKLGLFQSIGQHWEQLIHNFKLM